MATEIRVYPDERGHWRWRAVNTGNRKIVAASGESFDSQANAVRAAQGAKAAISAAPIKVLRPVRRVPPAPTNTSVLAMRLADLLNASPR